MMRVYLIGCALSLVGGISLLAAVTAS